jgi:hypothetical protein
MFFRAYFERRRERMKKRLQSNWAKTREVYKEMQVPLTVAERRVRFLRLCVMVFMAAFLPLLGWLLESVDPHYVLTGLLALTFFILHFFAGFTKAVAEWLASQFWPTTRGSRLLTDPKVVQCEAEHRCLQVLATIKAWEVLVPEDRRDQALAVIRRVYELSCIGESNIVIPSTPVREDAEQPTATGAEEPSTSRPVDSQ